VDNATLPKFESRSTVLGRLMWMGELYARGAPEDDIEKTMNWAIDGHADGDAPVEPKAAVPVPASDESLVGRRQGSYIPFRHTARRFACSPAKPSILTSSTRLPSV
jgi:hypothetical protein